MNDYTEFLNRWAARAERLHRVGIHTFGFDPGFRCTIDNHPKSINIPESLAKIICGLVIKAYPETKSDKAMIKAFKKRQEEAATRAKIKVGYKKKKRKTIKKPDNWYAFSRVQCELFSLGINDRGVNNMSPESRQLYCKRKDRQGRDRPKGELLHCHWNVCPRLKKERI